MTNINDIIRELNQVKNRCRSLSGLGYSDWVEGIKEKLGKVTPREQTEFYDALSQTASEMEYLYFLGLGYQQMKSYRNKNILKSYSPLPDGITMFDLAKAWADIASCGIPGWENKEPYELSIQEITAEVVRTYSLQ